MMHGNVILHPRADHQTPRRFWQGCPTIQCTPKGTLFAGWYSGGAGEPSLGNYNLLVRSRDGGLSWSDPLLVIESLREEDILAIDIQLWLDPQGRMWLFWCRRDDHFRQDDPRHMFTWALICENPDEPLLRWSAPREIAPGFLRCQPTVLSDGRILLCSYDWTAKFDETMVLELRNHELLMFARSEQQCIARSVSRDGGRSWSDGARTDLVAPSSRFFIARLPSGSVLRISNNHPEERRNLTAFLSDGAPGDQTILKHLVSKAPTRPYDGLLFQQEQERDEQWLEQYKLFNRAGGK